MSRALPQACCRSWSRSHRMSSWPAAVRLRWRCCRRPAPYQSCSRRCTDPVGCRLRRQPGAARRQHHRLSAVRIRPERQMAGAAQGGRARGLTRVGAHLGSVTDRASDRAVRRYPGGRVFARYGRCFPLNVRDVGRDRARHRRHSRASPNGGMIVTASAVDADTSRADHRARGAAPACRRSIPIATSSTAGGLVSYGRRRSSISIGAPQAMSTASSRARSRPTCRCRRRPNTSW